MIKRVIQNLFWRWYEHDLSSEDFDPEEREKFFEDLKGNEDLRNLLKAILRGDKDRYFRVSNDVSRNIIRGEYIRTLYQ